MTFKSISSNHNEMLMFCASGSELLEQEFNSILRPQNQCPGFKDEDFPSAKAAASSQSAFPLKGLQKMALCRVDNSGSGTAGKYQVKGYSAKGNLQNLTSFVFPSFSLWQSCPCQDWVQHSGVGDIEQLSSHCPGQRALHGPV